MQLNSSTLSASQLVGQRLMVGFEGSVFSDDIKYLIDTLKVGGVILFAYNLTSPAQIRRLCNDIQACARQSGSPPLFIAVDQEGGQVDRLKKWFTRFDGNAAMRTEADAEAFGNTTADELKSVGFNMNMAPVVDIAPADIQSIMAQRSFGSDPQWVARLGAIVIDRHQAAGVMAVAKHFPGIGRTTLDSHMEMPTLSIEADQLAASDLIPFQTAIDHHVAGIMLSHIYYDRLDPKWPASLSPRIARDMLRSQLGYEGLVLTDDLDMGAIRKHFDIQTAIAQILQADIDLTLICHKGPDIQAAHDRMLALLESSADLKARAIESVDRILHCKTKYLED